MFYGWLIVIFMCLAGAFGSATVWYGFTAFFDPLIEEFGWSYTAISIAASFRGAEHGLITIIVGFLIDQYGSRRIILVGSLLVGLGFLLLTQINSLVLFYASFVVISVGVTGVDSVVAQSLIARWFRKRLGLALGIAASGLAAGGLAIPGIVYLLESIGLRPVFLIFGLGAIIIGTTTAYVVRNQPQDLGYGPDGVPLYKNEPVLKHLNNIDIPAVGSKDHNFKKAILKRPFWTVTFVTFAYFFSVMTIITHIMPYLESVGYSRYEASIVAMALPAMSIVGRLGMGAISDFVNHKLILVIAVIGQAVGILFFANANIFPLLVLSVFFSGISWGGINVLRVVILRDYYGRASLGSLLGLCIGLGAIGGVAGPLIGGVLFDMTGDYNTTWLIIMGLFIITLPLLITLRDP